MSGPAATRVLRTQHGYGGCIAALTGYVDEDTYKECMSSYGNCAIVVLVLVVVALVALTSFSASPSAEAV
eukprot:1853-Heterococcus_DN1.PRE.6